MQERSDVAFLSLLLVEAKGNNAGENERGSYPFLHTSWPPMQNTACAIYFYSQNNVGWMRVSLQRLIDS